jgi:hypothetical protein
MPTNHTTLTFDERKAAEAAFHNRPFDPAWSESAHRIYMGLRRTLKTKTTLAEKSTAPKTIPQHRVTRPVRPCQAWLLEYKEQADSQLILFPLSARLEFIFAVLQLKAAGRSFTARMVTLGAFALASNQHP